MSVAITTPICFKIVQLFFGRSFDVDDLIYNFIGIIIGVIIAYAVPKAKPTDVSKGR